MGRNISMKHKQNKMKKGKQQQATNTFNTHKWSKSRQPQEKDARLF